MKFTKISKNFFSLLGWTFVTQHDIIPQVMSFFRGCVVSFVGIYYSLTKIRADIVNNGGTVVGSLTSEV